jgi:hypothetical protein
VDAVSVANRGRLDVQCGLALRIVGNVADQRGHLHLFADGNLLIALFLPIEVEQERIAQSTVAVKVAA